MTKFSELVSKTVDIVAIYRKALPTFSECMHTRELLEVVL